MEWLHFGPYIWECFWLWGVSSLPGAAVLATLPRRTTGIKTNKYLQTYFLRSYQNIEVILLALPQLSIEKVRQAQAVHPVTNVHYMQVSRFKKIDLFSTPHKRLTPMRPGVERVVTSSCILESYLCWHHTTYRGVTRGKGDHNSSGAKSLRGAANKCRGRQKVPKMSPVLSLILHMCIRKTWGSNIEASNMLLTAGSI